MGIDTTAAGKVIAAQMEAIEKDYENSDDHRIGAVVTIIEVNGPNGSEFRVRNNLGNPFMALGIMRIAEHQLLVGGMQGMQGGA
jgi:hypothetical protein